MQPDYEILDSPNYAVVDTALSSVDGVYETKLPWSSIYETYDSPSSTMMTSLETEKQIYDEPFEIEENYGPIYHEPPSNVNKIYEEIERGKIPKINHDEIRCV